LWFQLTAFLTPKERLINEDFPTPDCEWWRSPSEAAWREISVITTYLAHDQNSEADESELVNTSTKTDTTL
jgi:hypothetical protein